MVSTERPAQSSASVRQERCGSPSTSTAQAPHSPSSQPCLVPVRPSSSRSTSSSVLYGANETSAGSPFTLRLTLRFRDIVWAPNKLASLLYCVGSSTTTLPLAGCPAPRRFPSTSAPVLPHRCTWTAKHDRTSSASCA